MPHYHATSCNNLSTYYGSPHHHSPTHYRRTHDHRTA
jgi:hypothetical protein